MRIGLVCPYSLDVAGGVQSHVRDLGRSLMSRGHQVRVLAPGRPDRAVPSYVQTIGPSVPVRYNGSVARLAFGPRVAVLTRAWIRDGDFDVVHVHEPTSPSLGMLAALASDRPVVGTFHSAIRRSVASQSLGGPLRRVVAKLAAQIAVSESARRSMVAAHLGGDPLIVPNGIDYASFSSADPRDEWSSPGPTLAFLGRCDEPRKGLKVLLDAFDIVHAARPDARLLIAGPGAVRQRSAGWRPSADSVEWLGPLSDRDRSSLLASVDLFVAPNTGGESFGIILVEAMAAGATVVASDLPAFAAVLEGGRAGRLFATGDASAAATAVGALLRDPARARELSAHGRASAKAYDWSRVVPAIEAVYEGVLDQR